MIKLKLIFLVFLCLFAAVIVKLFYLQVINPQSQDNIVATQSITPVRGRIFDRNGLPLAVNQTTYLLYAEPKQIQDEDSVIKTISSVLQINEASVAARFDKTKDWVALARSVTNDQKNSLQTQRLTGIGFQEEWQRYYPEASLAAHLLGFVGKNRDGSDVGYFGIEGYYDKDLTGLSGLLQSERDFLGRPILIGIQQKVDAENGRDLYLTVDKSIQDIAKSKLKEGLDTYKAQSGCAIVANPQTMDILAFSCLPDFDNQQYYQATDALFKNPGITDVYEPGSTFKPFVMAASINENKVKPDDMYDENGPVTVTSYTIRTWNDQYEGKISMTRILEKSSNVGMVYVGQQLGQDKLYGYLQRYGFGQPTGIDLQGENPSYLRSRNKWYPIDYATATFGQGIAVTPIQMVTAFSSLVNGGTLYKPHVVSKIASGSSENVINKAPVRTTVSLHTSEIIKKMLVAAVENGEVRWAKPEGYSFGGKTGTAQIPIAGHYDPSKTVASFIGFAPADKPRFIALVVLNQPQTSIWGSETAAPVFFEIAKELLVYYNIAPQ